MVNLVGGSSGERVPLVDTNQSDCQVCSKTVSAGICALILFGVLFLAWLEVGEAIFGSLSSNYTGPYIPNHP